MTPCTRVMLLSWYWSNQTLKKKCPTVAIWGYQLSQLCSAFCLLFFMNELKSCKLVMPWIIISMRTAKHYTHILKPGWMGANLCSQVPVIGDKTRLTAGCLTSSQVSSRCLMGFRSALCYQTRSVTPFFLWTSLWKNIVTLKHWVEHGGTLLSLHHHYT